MTYSIFYSYHCCVVKKNIIESQVSIRDASPTFHRQPEMTKGDIPNPPLES